MHHKSKQEFGFSLHDSTLYYYYDIVIEKEMLSTYLYFYGQVTLWQNLYKYWFSYQIIVTISDKPGQRARKMNIVGEK